MTGRIGRGLREVALELGFALVLVLVAEAVHRGTGWARLWCLFAALVVGHGGRAVLARRRRLRDAQRSTSLPSQHVP